MTLTRSQFDQAAAFIRTHALPVEQSLFAWAFEGGSPEVVLDALAPSQADDGDYVHLEPDGAAQEPTVPDTTRAFQIHRRIGTSPDHPQVRAGSAIS